MNTIDIINIGIEIRSAIIDCVNSSDDKWLSDHISPINLLGACAIASYAFQQKVLGLGYKCDFVYGGYKNELNHHCWIEYRGDIIDITATQFSKKFNSVEILSIHSLNYKSIAYNEDAILSVRRWEEQNPLNYDYVWDDNNLKVRYLGG